MALNEYAQEMPPFTANPNYDQASHSSLHFDHSKLDMPDDVRLTLIKLSEVSSTVNGIISSTITNSSSAVTPGQLPRANGQAAAQTIIQSQTTHTGKSSRGAFTRARFRYEVLVMPIVQIRYVSTSTGRLSEASLETYEKAVNATFSATRDMDSSELSVMVHSSNLREIITRACRQHDGREYSGDMQQLFSIYVTLKNYLKAAEKILYRDSEFLEELTLFVKKFLLSRSILSGFDLEALHQAGIMSTEHWQDAQQCEIQYDIDTVDGKYLEGATFDAYWAGILGTQPECAFSHLPAADNEPPSPRSLAIVSQYLHEDEGLQNPEVTTFTIMKPEDLKRRQKELKIQDEAIQRYKVMISRHSHSLTNFPRRLRQNFKRQHFEFYGASQSQEASIPYGELATSMRKVDDIWACGIQSIRDLTTDQAPRTLEAIISLLLVANSMRRTIRANDGFGENDTFFADLTRWRSLLLLEDRGLFDEIVLATWGTAIPSESLVNQADFKEETEYLQRAIRTLISRTAKESRTDQTPSHIFEIFRPNQIHRHGPSMSGDITSSVLSRPPDLPSAAASEHSTVAVVLMIGATFAVIIQFFLALRKPAWASRDIDLANPVDLANRFYIQPLQESPSVVFQMIGISILTLISTGQVKTFYGLKEPLMVQVQQQDILNEALRKSLSSFIDGAAHACLSILEKRRLRDHCVNMAAFLGLSQPMIRTSFSGVDHPDSQVVQSPASPESSSHIDSLTTCDSNSPTSSQSPYQNSTPLSDPGTEASSVSSMPTSKFQCRYCEKVCSTSTNLYRHVRDKHENHRVSCRKCGKDYSREDYRVRHETKCKKVGITR